MTYSIKLLLVLLGQEFAIVNGLILTDNLDKFLFFNLVLAFKHKFFQSLMPCLQAYRNHVDLGICHVALSQGELLQGLPRLISVQIALET